MKILDTATAAALLNLDPSQVRRLIRDGRLPATPIGRRGYAISEEAVRALAPRKRGRPAKRD